MLVLKRNHSQTEIEELAKSFRETWSDGQVIRSWLRSHSEELRKLAREEDWAWVNIGKALSQAGIKFKTDKGWTGENLRRAVDLAMKPKKVRSKEPQALSTAPVPAPPAPAMSSAPLPPAPLPSAISGEPEFRIIQRKER